MHYTATDQGSRHFEISTEHQEHLGKLDYATWLPKKAQVTINDRIVYSIIPAGFWQRSIEITRDGLAYAELKAGWRNNIILSFENGPTLYFKRKSLFDSTYVIINEEEVELAFIQADFKWNTLSFKYEIDVHDNSLDKDANLLLPFLLVYCVKYMRMRHAAVH